MNSGVYSLITNMSHEPVALEISFAPRGPGALLRWEADTLGVRVSRLAPPMPPGDLALALRALDVLQDPDYPTGWTTRQARHFAFDEGARVRLAALGLWEEPRQKANDKRQKSAPAQGNPVGRVPIDAPRRLGRRLYSALITDPIGRQALGTVRDHAAALGRPLALELYLPPEAPHLAALPWELLWDEGPAPLLLARGMVSGISRRLDLAQPYPPQRLATGPLRILAVSPLAGIGPELRQVERAARLEAFGPLIDAGQVVLEELEPVTRGALVRAIEAGGPPDILHFYGHGRLHAGEGELLLDDPGGMAWVPAPALAVLLGGVGLVTLFACQGASVGLGPGEPLLGGVAQALMSAGLPAVLGMQFAIRATAATRAAAALYQTLAEGHSLQAGVARARRALFVEERDRASWYVPALYLRDRAGRPCCLRSTAPPTTATPPAAPPPRTGAYQRVVATGGATIRSLRLEGQAGSTQDIAASDGASISDVDVSSSQ